MSIYLWYTWSKVRTRAFAEIGLRYIGQWAPLWFITVMVGYHRMDYVCEDGTDLRMNHVEYVVLDTTFLRKKSIDEDCAEEDPFDDIKTTHRYYYDITARSLWYFYFMGDSYTEYLTYARGLLPYDLAESRFDAPDNEIEVKYSGDVDETFSMIVLTLCQNEKYRMRINEEPELTHGIKFNTVELLNID
jgi:hypothetical protein